MQPVLEAVFTREKDIVTLFSSATLVTEPLMEPFRELPPMTVEVSL